MQSKFLQKRQKFSKTRRKIRQAIVIPTLTLILMAAQLAPQLFFSNEAVLNLINELPTTAVVYAAPLTEEELAEYPDEAVKKNELNSWAGVNEERTLTTVKYNKSTGKSEVYYSTKGYVNHKEFREAMIDEYGEDFLLYEGANSTVSSMYYKWQDLLSSKSERAKLAKIAAKYLPGIEESYVAAPEVAIATYYGAINDPWDYVKYKNNKAITRQQMCALVYRIQQPNYTAANVDLIDGVVSTMGKSNKYNLILSATTRAMYNGGVKYTARNGNAVGKYSKKAMKSSATRKEVIFLAMETYHQSGWGMYGSEEYEAKAVKQAKKIFNDLSKASHEDCLLAYRAYELGIIKPDKNGNSNINKKCSMSLALRYVFAAQGAGSKM